MFLYLGILDLRAKQTCLLQLDDICIEEAEESDFDFFLKIEHKNFKFQFLRGFMDYASSCNEVRFFNQG